MTRQARQRLTVVLAAALGVDEARLFLDAQVWNDIYSFTELNLITREDSEGSLRIGEVYLDFERVLKARKRFATTPRQSSTP